MLNKYYVKNKIGFYFKQRYSIRSLCYFVLLLVDLAFKFLGANENLPMTPTQFLFFWLKSFGYL